MDESHSRPNKKWQIPAPLCQPESQCQYALKAEEKILQAISARAPIPEILNEICAAIDCQIGNTVSVISLFQDGTTIAAEIARKPALFGMHVFSCANILNERGEELGSLEVYCCVPRDPSTSEVHLMERARYLAALSVGRDTKADYRANCCVSENGPVPERALEWN
jgi:hypothetical protein